MTTGSGDRERLDRIVSELERVPTHAVLAQLCEVAHKSKRLNTVMFRRLAAFLLDEADGGDRRHPWTTRAGDVRPVPRLRITLEKCFDEYADLHWFNMNKTAHALGGPMNGLFPRMSMSLGRVKPDVFARVVTALTSATPDASFLRLIQDGDGRVPGVGVQLFSQLGFAFRRDLFFTLPRPWSDSSGCRKFINGDLRKYCELCRNLRVVCDDLGFPPEVRAAVLDRLLRLPKPPVALLEALHRAIGPALAPFGALAPDDAYEDADADEMMAMPLEFAARAVRARRGHQPLRDALVDLYGERCVLTGDCPKDLLEVASVAPFHAQDPHSPRTALLMRSDVHTLWDLNLIGVEGRTMQVHVSPKLTGTVYEKLVGRRLPPRTDGTNVDGRALRERWKMFISAHPSAEVTDGERSSAPTRHRAPSRDPRTGGDASRDNERPSRHAPSAEARRSSDNNGAPSVSVHP